MHTLPDEGAPSAGHAVIQPMATRQDIRVVLADRPGPARDALAILLAQLSRVQLVATADDVEGAGEALRAHDADFLLLDERLIVGDHVLAGLGRQPPSVEVIVVGMDVDPAFDRRARRIGALGWVAKERAEEDLPALLRR